MSEPIIYLNGLFWPQSKARVSVLDRGFIYGDGLFETLRAYSNKIFRLDDHLDRLFRSAQMIFLELPMTRNEIGSAVNQTLEINGLSDSIIRLTVTRGEQEPGINIDYGASPTVVIQARPVAQLPTLIYQNGIAISLFNNSAPRVSGLCDQIKSCNFLSQIVLREKAVREGAFECVMLDDRNHVAEGTTSNIFIVKNNELKTPELSEFVLPGVTRQVMLEIASASGIPCKELALTENDIYSADEVFITNTGIEVLPVRSVNRRLVGDGKPGAMTRHLHKLFLGAL